MTGISSPVNPSERDGASQAESAPGEARMNTAPRLRRLGPLSPVRVVF
jgi:hypothetical protein